MHTHIYSHYVHKASEINEIYKIKLKGYNKNQLKTAKVAKMGNLCIWGYVKYKKELLVQEILIYNS